jgi:hypothetical protein
MRRIILALFAIAALAGCAETLQGMYDDRAREECDNNTDNSRSRGDCYDNVDRNSRAHRDDW